MQALKLTLLIAALAALPTAGLLSCGGTGACIGTGGVLSSPVCKEDWDEAECDDWNSQKINDANWTYHGGDSCSDFGYSETCSDGSYRLPGNC